ncbi:MAG: hypothetical protein AABW51_02550 [Nanoarchaeota archaeon]
MVGKVRISYVLNENYFVVPGVSYKGETGTWNVFENLTGQVTQDELVEYSEKEKQKGNPYLMDLPLHFAVFLAAYKLRNGQDAKRLRAFLQNSLRRHLHTLTRIAYNPDGIDEAMHNYGTSEQYSLKGTIIGPDQWIKDMEDKKTLEILLSTEDVVQINNVFKWISKKNGYICRVNLPTKEDEEAVRLYAGDDRFYLDCGKLGGACPAIRVMRVD